MQLPTPNPIIRRQASPSLAAQIHKIIVHQMADELIAKGADLSKTKRVKRALLEIGFGRVSVHALAKRARIQALARRAAH